MRIVRVGWRLVMASAVGVWILAPASLVGAQATRAEPRLALVIAAGRQGRHRSLRLWVDALFDGARGVGNRTEVRPCSLTFVK
jgi:hypothetical protein